jgi:hypothetical protein
MRKLVSQQFAIVFVLSVVVYLALLIMFAFLVLLLEIDLDTLVYGRVAKIAMIATPAVLLIALVFEVISYRRKK